jgi:ribosomal protein S18 acetylase RimI-like enzyme
MATAAAARGQGIGAAVLAAVVDALSARGARLLWCEAREAAIGFYERNGFQADGAVYIAAETGLPHRYMWRELGAAPTSS